LNRAGDRPDEADHLACYGDIHDIGGFAARAQPPISGAEPHLRFPSDIANDFWRRFDPPAAVATDDRAETVTLESATMKIVCSSQRKLQV